MPNELVLAIKFANYDNARSPVLRVNPNITVKELKQKILEVWPKTYDTVSPKTELRAIVLGKLLDDDKSLEASNVPVFEDFPTPVHVSVKPSKSKSSSTLPATGKYTKIPKNIGTVEKKFHPNPSAQKNPLTFHPTDRDPLHKFILTIN